MRGATFRIPGIPVNKLLTASLRATNAVNVVSRATSLVENSPAKLTYAVLKFYFCADCISIGSMSLGAFFARELI
jgi:hypothetical protein